jgi:hypothetical protein
MRGARLGTSAQPAINISSASTTLLRLILTCIKIGCNDKGGSPMGLVFRLPMLAPTEPYPDASAALDRPERTLLTAIRWWVTDHRHGDDPLPRLCRTLDSSNVHDAAFSVDQLMFVVARSAHRQVAIHCPRCPTLSDDEKHLLNAASLAQAGRSDLAERALRTALLTAQAAEFALGPLEGLADLFAEAKLLLRRRRTPAADHQLSDRTVDPACIIGSNSLTSSFGGFA